VSPELVFTRNRAAWLSAPIQAWTGDYASHCAVRLDEDTVIDATLWHGVQRWSWERCGSMHVIVHQIPVNHVEPVMLADANRWINEQIGTEYDIWEILGHPLLRNLGSDDRYVCSSLALQWWIRATGITPAGRLQRFDPRHLRIAASVREQALLSLPV
jgi:uncharacterized protein YycO